MSNLPITGIPMTSSLPKDSIFNSSSQSHGIIGSVGGPKHKRIPSANLTADLATFGTLNADTAAVEQDPTGRYLRYPLLLGRGACKRVFRAIDCTSGIEMAWNQVEVSCIDMEEKKDSLFAEIRVLQALHHRNIMSFHDWWFNEKNRTINFITEVFSSGTLRQYRKKTKVMNENILRRWAWQILEGLVYLHGHKPPIVHRDLKCDNIFFNANNGQVKIGDLGLATAQQGLSVVGTPEFMAPEIYDENYNEKVDIYSYGMCLLELATLKYPYSECHGVAQIFRKVSQGIKPQALDCISGVDLRHLIDLCIEFDPQERPEARMLLKHPFFDPLRIEHDMLRSSQQSLSGLLSEQRSVPKSPSNPGPQSASSTAARDCEEKASSGEQQNRMAPSPLGRAPNLVKDTPPSELPSPVEGGISASSSLVCIGSISNSESSSYPDGSKKESLLADHGPFLAYASRLQNAVKTEDEQNPTRSDGSSLGSPCLAIPEWMKREYPSKDISNSALTQDLTGWDDGDDGASDSSDEVVIPMDCLAEVVGLDEGLEEDSFDDLGDGPAALNRDSLPPMMSEQGASFAQSTSVSTCGSANNLFRLMSSDPFGNFKRPSGGISVSYSENFNPCGDGDCDVVEAGPSRSASAQPRTIHGRSASASITRLRSFCRVPDAFWRSSMPLPSGLSNNGLNMPSSSGYFSCRVTRNDDAIPDVDRSLPLNQESDVDRSSPLNREACFGKEADVSSRTGIPTSHKMSSLKHASSMKEQPVDTARPIYGIIVRVKQCRGKGFDKPSIEAPSSLKRSPTM